MMPGRTARILNLILGVWLFISAFVWPHNPAQQTNTWIMGVIGVVVALVAMSVSPARWVNTAMSIWLFISVWALPHQNLATQWNNALVAIAIFVLSLVPSGPERTMVPQRSAT